MGRPPPAAALLLTALWALCAPFNIDVLRPRLFHGPPEAQFGYKVLQHSVGSERWLLVTAPWDGPQGDHRGDVYKCPLDAANGTCSKTNLGDAVLRSPNQHLGMALSGGADGGVLVCAPLWSQQCGSSVFSSGRCERLDRHLRHSGTVTPTAQRCPTFLDIVILLDGSNSIYPWHEVQRFLRALLARFFVGPQQSQVAVLQYGERAVQEWPLGRYRSAAELIAAAQNIRRRESRETRTAAAIRMACSEAFSPAAGGRRGAARLLVVLTDGESHDGERLREALRVCEGQNVTRLGIAVLGHYLRRQRSAEQLLREVRSIASRPALFFNVSDERALRGIVGALGERIFSLEGTHGDNGSAFALEMAQSGFSIHPLQDGTLFGAVGAYDWDGAVVEQSGRGRSVPTRERLRAQFRMGPENHAAYLGYAVSALLFADGRRLLVGGAPRFRHRGAVLIFQMGPGGAVRAEQTLSGEQVGSYFGSELCVVDVDGDGRSDVLLVGAPHFQGERGGETGRVYVYGVGARAVRAVSALRPLAALRDARFGSALAAIPDVNGDGWADAAVGAPLEEGHRGALYVFHGAAGGLRERHAQRIAAAELNVGLRYFGRSIDGRSDADGDGVGLAVGAMGAAVLLRSRPSLRVSALLSLSPSAISAAQKNCRRGAAAAVCIRGTVCFRSAARGRAGRGDVALHYNVSLDDGAVRSRAAFDSGSRRLRRRMELPLGEQRCAPIPFHVLDTTDFLHPLILTLRLALPDPAGPVLDEGSPSVIRTEIPFFKDCGEDDVCVTDLSLRATMQPLGAGGGPGVVRGGRRKVRVEAVLQNRKENAYNARVALRSSANLHFSSVALPDGSAVKLECTALGEHQQLCSVGYPVFRSMAKVLFTLEFEFSCSVLLNQVEVALEATSDSTEPNATLWDNAVRLSAPIRYEPDLFLSSEATLHRYEVRPHGTFPHGPGPEFRTTVKVQNLGCFAVRDVALRLALPSLGYGRVPFLSVTGVRAENATCELRDPPNGSVRAVHPADLQRVGRMDCSSAWCRELNCALGRLQRGHGVTVHVLRAVHNDFFRAATFSSVRIVSTATLSAAGSALLLLDEGAHRHETVLEVLRERRVPVSLWILVGSALGGLLLLAAISVCLWKFGFFTRPKPHEEEEEEEQ